MKKNIGKKVCGIVVSFIPDIKTFKHNLKVLQSQLDHIIIIDNTPSSEFDLCEQIQNLVKDTENITLFQNKSNLGIARALNQGITTAIKKGYNYITTFDQDSYPEKGMVNALLNFYDTIDSDFAILSPQSIDKFETVKKVKTAQIVDKAITSGMLFKSDIIKKCGLMEEEMFIDYVDFEYCLRFRKMGGLIYLVPGPRLVHRLGSIEEFKFLNKMFWPTNHSAFRRYFITRNRIYVWKKYFTNFPKWILRDVKFFVIETALIILAEKDKLNKLLSILKGCLHGIFFSTKKIKLNDNKI